MNYFSSFSCNRDAFPHSHALRGNAAGTLRVLLNIRIKQIRFQTIISWRKASIEACQRRRVGTRKNIQEWQINIIWIQLFLL